MSTLENTNYLEQKLEEFDHCLFDNGIDQAHNIFMELYENGFDREGIELENKWDDFMKEHASPQYWKERKAEDEANNGHPSEI